MKGIIVFFVLSLCPVLGITQNQEINGTIVAFNKYPLKNVRVGTKKAKTETFTNERGTFEIKVNENDVLIIEADAFENYKHRVKPADKTLKINLIYENRKKNKEIALNAGYISKGDLEYGLEFLIAENNVFSTFTNIYDAIIYAIPSATIINENGLKKVQMRGAKSATGSNAALMVVNGYLTEDVSYIIPSNIISIKMLNSSSAVIYGMGSGNGVIEITTK
jgi:hypothetical protein